MTLEVTEKEREYLLELLEAAHKTLLHELHHSATTRFRDLLRQKLELLEGLKAKMKTAGAEKCQCCRLPADNRAEEIFRLQQGRRLCLTSQF
jgi:hypothetical protein